MSGKLLHTLSDEHPDLRKQIGCMNGIFQLFDRHHFLGGGRRINGRTHKRLPPGQGKEPNNAIEKAKEKNPKKFVKEKQRISTESSRTSFSSSSCSSTFSSVDCNRTAQTEVSSFSQTNFPDTPSRDSTMTQLNASPRLGRQSDFRDIVKDSIYREGKGLSVKTAARKEPVSHPVKHIDSPRPMHLSKEPIPVPGVDESVRTLGRLREPPRNSNDRKDGALVLTPRDAPRFSYDGRESRDLSKSAMKLKELPRLSLDSRMRSSASELKSSYLLRDLHKGNGNSSKILSTQQEPGSNKKPSSVVAKLMGLDMLPDSSMSINDDQMEAGIVGDTNPFSRPSQAAEESKQHRISRSPRNFPKDPVSPRLRSAGSVMKSTSTSRFPIEPAPWRQMDGSQGHQKPTFKLREATTQALNSTPSIYGEIEKRLPDVEFDKSGKDLRALKHFLEQMQKTKGTIETRKDQASNSPSQTSNNSLNCSSPVRSSKAANHRNSQSNSPTATMIRGSSSPTSFKSPIVIMRPAKLIKKPHNLASSAIPIDDLSRLPRLQTCDLVSSRKDSVDKQTAKDLTSRNKHLREPSSHSSPLLEKHNTADRSLRLTKTSKVHQKFTEENTSSSIGRYNGAVSPRLQQMKLRVEKQSHPTIPSPESSRVRRQSSRQTPEPSSPARKLRQRSLSSLQSDDQLSEISSDSRNLSYQGDTNSIQSESNISSVSQMDIEVTSIDRSGGINSISFQRSGHKHRNPAERWGEDGTMTKFTTATQEQPSPVSVLDAAFYKDDLPSPVKKISNAFKEDETPSSYEMEWTTVDLYHSHDSSRPSLSSDFNHKRFQNIENLVQRIKELNNSSHNEFNGDLIASLYDKTNPDHIYIYEILLASGLLRDRSGLMYTQLQRSGHPINPKLFLVLEQNRAVANILNDKYSKHNIAQSKLQRELIFDVVNELLSQKLASVGSSEPCLSPNKIGRRSRNGQELLRELCSEIDQLQANSSDCSVEDDDIMHRSANWTDFHGEVSGIALDIERLIFKDLIGEVLNGEATLSQVRPRGHIRQLFSK